MTPDEIRRRLIKSGIEKIKASMPEAEVTPENIFSEHSLTFRAILINTKGTTTEEVDAVIEELLVEMGSGG